MSSSALFPGKKDVRLSDALTLDVNEFILLFLASTSDLSFQSFKDHFKQSNLFYIQNLLPMHLNEDGFMQTLYAALLQLLFKPPSGLHLRSSSSSSSASQAEESFERAGKVVAWNVVLVYLLYVFLKTSTLQRPIRLHLSLLEELILCHKMFFQTHRVITTDPLNVCNMLLSTENLSLASLAGPSHPRFVGQTVRSCWVHYQLERLRQKAKDEETPVRESEWVRPLKEMCAFVYQILEEKNREGLNEALSNAAHR